VFSRFSQQYVAVLNLLLIGTTVYFLALAVNNGIKLHLAWREVSGFSQASVQKPVVRPQTGPRSRAYYNTIVQRDIFSLAPQAPPPPPPAVENENLNITLVGTSHLSLSRPFIIVESPDGEQSLFRQGDTIPNVGRVLSIGHNQAVVLHNGHRVLLQIPSAGEGGTSQPTPFGWHRPRFRGPPPHLRGRHGPPLGRFGRVSSNAGVQRLSSSRYLIGRETVDQKLSNMGSLLAQIRAAPNLHNGSSNGFRLSQIQPGSIFQQLGLQDGDIVTGAEGQQVNDPLRAMVLLNSLRNSRSVSLSVIRNGSPMQLHYTIH
jgi:type II secretion system protein C